MENLEPNIQCIVVGALQVNSYLISCPQTKQALIIDAGDDPELILEQVQRLQVQVQYLLATHGHFDHVGGVDWLQKQLDVPFYIHMDDVMYVMACKQIAENYQISFQHMEVPKISGHLQNQQALKIGNIVGQAIHTPGHSLGGMSFLFGRHLFSGDTLFAEVIGRTDLKGGSFKVLAESIRQKLYTLPPDTIVYPGHGIKTTIGHEQKNNNFVLQN